MRHPPLPPLQPWPHRSRVTRISDTLDAVGYALIDAADMRSWLVERTIDQDDIDGFLNGWNDLRRDDHMADGGRYRLRRHAVLHGAAGGGPLVRQPDQPHFQTIAYNPLNGGVDRHFAPILDETLNGPIMGGLLSLAAACFGTLVPAASWHIEVHQIRIDATTGGGRPTPEGRHRDGVDFVMMTLVDRRNVGGGTSTIHRADDQEVAKFTLSQTFATAMVDDHRVTHAVSDVTPIHAHEPAYRDMLIVTFRAMNG